MWLDIISIGLSALLSGLSIFIAIRAYKQGTKQIEISNKQSLFKERTKVFLQLNSLYEIYGQNNHLLDGSSRLPDFPFHVFTSNKFLKDATIAIYEPLKNEKHNEFLLKVEDLREIALQISLLWEGEESKLAKDFVYAYVQLLSSLYGQQIYINDLNNRENMELSEFKSRTEEMACEVGLNDAIKLIDEIYNQMKSKDIINTLKEQIKLK